MTYYLRFEQYDDLSRKAAIQIHPEVILDNEPRFTYGQMVQIGQGDIPISEKYQVRKRVSV